jgi:hypothetical protein
VNLSELAWSCESAGRWWHMWPGGTVGEMFAFWEDFLRTTANQAYLVSE